MSLRHPFLTHHRPLAVAHRGGAMEAEENTMAAFQHAVDLGYSHVETDVHATRDGVAVIHHDATLARMTGDPRAIADLDWAELALVRSFHGAAIPRVDALLAAYPYLNITFELKCDRVAGPLADAITGADALGRVCVGSFSRVRTGAMRALLGPDLCWSPAHAGVGALWLAGCGLPVPHPVFGVVQVPPVFRGIPVVTRRFTVAAARLGVDVQVWTVNEPDQMVHLIDLGVGAIMTDRPRVLRNLLQARGQWQPDPPRV